MFLTAFFYVVIVLSLLNLIRLSFYLIGSDFYTIRSIKKNKANRKNYYLPTVTVIVPVHNEQTTLLRCLKSVYNSNYPHNKLELIIVNDGSTDRSKTIIKNFRKNHKYGCKIRYANRKNKGKAAALNYGIQNLARHSLIMCLDSDSYLDSNSIRNAAKHFRDKNVVALSSNVNIANPHSSLLALLQRYEYIVCYQMKKGQAELGFEYIVGGIGSMFRKKIISQVRYYDTNTMTEDIDLTLKILVNKKHHQKIDYAADSIVYTEPTYTLKELLKQRFRWKYGRNQTYLKNKSYIFSTQQNHNKRISWFVIPFTLFQDLIFLLEPAIVIYFLYITIYYHDVVTIFLAMMVLTVYLLLNIWNTPHLELKEKLQLSFISPVIYFLMYVLSFAEYYALIKSIIDMPKLKSSIKTHTVWKSPSRRKIA